MLVHQWGDLISISIEHHKVSKMKRDFRQLVAEKFPAGIDNLHNLLGTTKYRVTQLLKDEYWRNMTGEEVVAWANAMKMDRSDLIMQYGCGRRGMSMDEADMLVREEGMQFPDMIPHVA